MIATASYTALPTRTNPTLFLGLVDTSGSMSEEWNGEFAKKDIVAQILNEQLLHLVKNCQRGTEIRDYTHVSVMQYNSLVTCPFGNDVFVWPVSKLAANPKRIEPSLPPRPIWVEPHASGGTSMRRALEAATVTVGQFVEEYPDSFPPIVVHLTDGEPSDGNPEAAAENLKALATSDGNVLLFNAHISGKNKERITFPRSEDTLPNDYARMLFRMSSVLPVPVLEAASLFAGRQLEHGARAFLLNAAEEDISALISWGTDIASNSIRKS